MVGVKYGFAEMTIVADIIVICMICALIVGLIAWWEETHYDW